MTKANWWRIVDQRTGVFSVGADYPGLREMVEDALRNEMLFTLEWFDSEEEAHD